MVHLRWSFDWPVRRAVAVAPHGTYVISGEGPSEWSAKFTRVDTEAFRKTQRALDDRGTRYESIADAMRACQRHAEQFSSDSSDRLLIVTPVP